MEIITGIIGFVIGLFVYDWIRLRRGTGEAVKYEPGDFDKILDELEKEKK